MDWMDKNSMESLESVGAVLESNFGSPIAKIYKLVELKKGEKSKHLCVKFPLSKFSCTQIESIMTEKLSLEKQVEKLNRKVAELEDSIVQSDKVRMEALETVNLLKDEFTHLIMAKCDNDSQQPRPFTERPHTARTPPIPMKFGEQQICQTARVKLKTQTIETRRAPRTVAWSIRKP